MSKISKSPNKSDSSSPRIFYPVIRSESSLPFFLTGIGVSEPEYHIKRPEGLVSHQILFTLSGSGVLEIDGKKYPQTAGSIFYLSPAIPHEYYPEGENWTTAWLVYRGKNLPLLMESLGFPKYAEKSGANTASLKILFDRIFSAANDSAEGGERCSVLIYECLLSARKTLFSEAGSSVISEKAMQYIDLHYAEDIEEITLARLCGVSVQHFCRVFKEQTGMRPIEYITRRRIATAKNLLCGSFFPVKEIASMVGYNSLTYFGMVFKKQEGVSPVEYRKTGGV